MSRGDTVGVWDPLVRLFHWSLAVSFLGAYVLDDDGGDWHQTLGYVALGLIGFRPTFLYLRHA
jgi:cytochrome b